MMKKMISPTMTRTMKMHMTVMMSGFLDFLVGGRAVSCASRGIE